jgi:glycosyltransferase involved in cell wall biosynthesis
VSDVGVIAIGRNEGERLRACLASVVGRDMTVVYVDSGSTDGSVEMARSMGADVVELDLSIPFSAARARNEGLVRLSQIQPNVEFVQFVDGDCEVVPAWIETAREAIKAKPQAAVVCGRRRERHPEHSVYNRLADLEWDAPVGEVKSCGGDAMFRVWAFQQAGGFNPTVVAGEEPELCQRLRESGWTIHRIAAEMTVHDSAILHFGQWWKRQVRSGYGAMDVSTRFPRGKDTLFANQVRSARLWTVLTLFMPLQAARLAVKAKRRLPSWKTAAAYGTLTMIGKWAHVLGQRQYLRDRASGTNTRLIDYKAATSA